MLVLFQRCCRGIIAATYIAPATSLHPRCRFNTDVAKLEDNPRRPGRKIAVLTNRALIEVSGKGSTALLQYIGTNDVRKLTEDRPVIYSVVLGSSARKKYPNIMYDLLIYRQTEDEYYIECDQLVSEWIEVSMSPRVRKRVGKGPLIQLLEQCALQQDLHVEVRKSARRVCSVFHPGLNIQDYGFCDPYILTNKIHKVLHEDERVYADPRCGQAQLGSRILADDAEDLMRRINPAHYQVVSLDVYKQHRYMLGVCEGFREFGYGVRSALDCNVDHLGGLDFMKDVPFIGQDNVGHLGAQPFKRIMPCWVKAESVEALTSENSEQRGSSLRGKQIFHNEKVVGKMLDVSRIPLRQFNKQKSTKKDKKITEDVVNVLVGICYIDTRKIIFRDAWCFEKTQLSVMNENKERVPLVSFYPDWWPLFPPKIL